MFLPLITPAKIILLLILLTRSNVLLPSIKSSPTPSNAKSFISSIKSLTSPKYVCNNTLILLPDKILLYNSLNNFLSSLDKSVTSIGSCI